MTEKKRLILILLVCVYLIATGFCDLDAFTMAQRFSEYWRSVDFWEFCPYIKINWWIAYTISLLKIAMGCFLLGFIVKELKENLKLD